MSSVGTYLRELRQSRGISLEEIARTTRVAQRYLESLEADGFDALPSPVFTRGFIRAYCQALNESPDEALAAFEGRQGRTPPLAPGRPAPPPPRAAEAEPRGRGAVLVSFVLLVVLGVALFGVALVIHPRDRGERAAVETRQETRPTRPPDPTPSASTPPAAVPPTAAPPAAVAAPRPTTAPSVPAAPPAAAPATTVMPPVSAAPAPAPSLSPAPTIAPRPPVGPNAAAAPGVPTPAAPTSAASAPPASVPAPRPPASPGAAVVASAQSTPPVPAASAPSPPHAVPAAVSAPALEGLAGTVTSPYRLVARTSETTWIRVRTEDGRMVEENVPAGEIREWVSNRPFVLTIGNAGGVVFEL